MLGSETKPRFILSKEWMLLILYFFNFNVIHNRYCRNNGRNFGKKTNKELKKTIIKGTGKAKILSQFLVFLNNIHRFINVFCQFPAKSQFLTGCLHFLKFIPDYFTFRSQFLPILFFVLTNFKDPCHSIVISKVKVP